LQNINLNDVSHPLRCRKKWLQLHEWYQSHLGQAVFHSEEKIIRQQLESCFGYTIVQLGNVFSENLIQSTRIKNKYILQCSINKNDIEGAAITSLMQHLAIKSNTVDVVLLHHCLEFEAFPHEILREVERILVAEGKLIIVLFNPFSLMGLWHFLLRLKAKVTGKKVSMPVEQTWISSRRLDDWLALLGFDSQKVGSVFFRPPINNLTILKKLNFMEKTGKDFWPAFSGSIVYMAIKRVSTLTPMRPKWRLKEKVVGSAVAESGVPEATNRKN